MIRRVVHLIDELRGHRPRFEGRGHPAPQQEGAGGVLLAFLGVRCEFGDDCAYPGLGWRCGHRRHGRGVEREMDLSPLARFWHFRVPLYLAFTAGVVAMTVPGWWALLASAPLISASAFLTDRSHDFAKIESRRTSTSTNNRRRR